MFRRLWGGTSRGPVRRKNGLVVFVLGLVTGLLVPTWGGRPLAADEESIAEGKQIFRFDTFGDEQKWTDNLGLNAVIESSISPQTALQLGLKIDEDALPPEVIAALLLGAVDLTDPAVTVELIRLNAVVGVVGTVEQVDGQTRLTKVGITCAICHSTVDNSLLPSFGHRLDGWPNHDLDPGKIIAASPAVPQAARDVYVTWGPGKYDPRFNIDGLSTPVVIPPAYGLDGVNRVTYTGDGKISYWNKYVAVTQMGGHGSFTDGRLGINIVQNPDLVAPKLPALRDYQHSLDAPPPPAGTVDPTAAARGKIVFNKQGTCAKCHIPPLYTDINLNRLHTAAETGVDPAYALRSVTKKYRTTPLRGLWQHPPYFHDGSAATLPDVVQHYDTYLHLGLSDQQKKDLVEFLKSL